MSARGGARIRVRHLAPDNISFAVVPALVVLVFAFLLPIAILLWKSLAEPRLGFGHYGEALTDPTSVIILLRTLIAAALVTAVAVLFGYPYAYVMTSVRNRWRTAMLAAVLVPFWTSLLARSFAWIVILQDHGPVNGALNWLGLPIVHLLGTEVGVVIGMTQVLLPFTVLPLYASLNSIDRRLIGAARGLGARPSVAFVKVFLPLSAPGLVAAGLLTYILALGFYVTPDLLGSPRESLLSQFIATKASRLLDFPAAGALAAILLAATLIVLGITALVLRHATRTRLTVQD